MQTVLLKVFLNAEVDCDQSVLAASRRVLTFESSFSLQQGLSVQWETKLSRQPHMTQLSTSTGSPQAATDYEASILPNASEPSVVVPLGNGAMEVETMSNRLFEVSSVVFSEPYEDCEGMAHSPLDPWENTVSHLVFVFFVRADQSNERPRVCVAGPCFPHVSATVHRQVCGGAYAKGYGL